VLSWLVIIGSKFGNWVYWHFFTITINYYSLQSILTAEASLHSASRSTTGCKRSSLSPINLWHGPHTENTLRTPYTSNSSIFEEVYLRCRYIALDACYWAMAPCNLEGGYRTFGETYRLHSLGGMNEHVKYNCSVRKHLNYWVSILNTYYHAVLIRKLARARRRK
jgi:hypothetical protein